MGLLVLLTGMRRKEGGEGALGLGLVIVCGGDGTSENGHSGMGAAAAVADDARTFFGDGNGTEVDIVGIGGARGVDGAGGVVGVSVAIDDGRVGDAVAVTGGVGVGPQVGSVWFGGVTVVVAGYAGTCSGGGCTCC